MKKTPYTEIRNQKDEIRRLLEQPRWKVALFMLVLRGLLFWQTVVDYYFYLNFNFLFARRAFFKRTKKRAHWVGSHIPKPHRFASALLAGVLVAGLFVAPHIQAVLYWSAGWGAVFSSFVIYRSSALIFKRLQVSLNKSY